jgi:pyridinium-3,5-biscarboxylic acid mononucleotide sulfurtransferase
MLENPKYLRLTEILLPLKRVLVTFSGGVDSTFLLKVAVDVLGAENVLAVIGTSPTYPATELQEARRLADLIGARCVTAETSEMEDDAFVKNSRERCYHCKSNLFDVVWEIARREGIPHVLEGSNLDDMSDFRPGRKACVEKGVLSPLLTAELTKGDIRNLSRDLGLPTHDKPSLACLSSRIPYGTPIDLSTLKRIEEAEELIRGSGIRQVRVRYHGAIARIEVPEEELGAVMEQRGVIAEGLKRLGFIYVALDLAGYRTGSMNEA